MIARGDTHRNRFSIEPALSLVPLTPGAPERLLADHCAGRLVVDVEVAGREPQPLGRLLDRLPVLGDAGAGQGIGGLVGHLPHHLVVVAVLVDQDPKDGAEILVVNTS